MRVPKPEHRQLPRSGRPPPWIEAVLRGCLPKGVVGDSILGDLREEFNADLRARPGIRAHLRYLRHAISVASRYVGWRPKAQSGLQGSNRTPENTMSTLWYDLRHSFRLLVRRPGLSTAAILSLGLGIGASTAIFSLVHTILLKPLPYPDAHELVEAFRVDEAVTGLNPTPERISNLWAVPYELHLDWLAASRAFAAGGGYAGTRVTLRDGTETNSLSGVNTTSGVFRALGIQPEMGRTFLPEDDQVGAPPVAVLSYGLWQSLLGGDPDIVGTQIHLEDTAYTITGVMPPGFAFPSDSYRIWLSFSDEQKISPTRNAGYLKVVTRLAPGVSLDQARREMNAFSVRNGELHPEEAEHRVGLFPQKDMIVGESGTGLLVLLGAVTLVLLIACTNIAGLFLVRATERRREIGMRRALGGSGRRLVFQQMSEILLLSSLGGAAGWGLAVVGLDPFLSLMPSELPRLGEMRVDENLLYTAIGLAVLTGILTGLLPALRAAKTPIGSVLQEGGRSMSGSPARNRTQTSLIVSQITLAFVLLAGAGLVIRSMTHLLAVETGFDTRNLALASVSFPSGADDMDDALVYFRDLEDRIRSFPGVVDVGAASQMPFAGGWSSPPMTVETTDGEWDGILHFPTVTPSYFTTMGIPVVEGRGFTQDDHAGSELVVVVSRALAERMAPEGSPLGLRIRLNTAGDSIWRTVVGVVGDVRYRLNFGAMAMAYRPLAQGPTFVDNWVVRTASDPASLTGMFQEAREELDPEGTSSYRALSDIVRGSTAVVSARFAVILLGSLAVLAALLATFGVYGVLAYLVQLRSREIGIQMALGAEHSQVLGKVLRRGLFMGVLGIVLGTFLAIGLGRVIESQLFGIRPWDPKTLGAVAVLLLGATLVASYLPARRAAGTDPVQVLKGE